MKSAWVDRDAEAAVERYAAAGIARDLALRVYTTRLLGSDPRLVLHGGGNTSVKTKLTDLNGDEVEVLCVKGSGWDMGSIEPAGLPAVRLAPLLKLRARKNLSDEDMVRLQRANLIDPAAPNPSVEALLHAFIPHKFVDHTHSTAVLALTDQPDGEALCREVFGARVGYVPYVMPGFGLAKAAAQVFDANPSVEGLILVKHGIFSFGADARQSYERMIALVDAAEVWIAKNRRQTLVGAKLPARPARLAEVAPIVTRAAVAAFGERYRDYFSRHNARVGGSRTMLDPMPRVVLVPGLGLFGLGRSKKDAAIAADLAEAAVATITDAEAVGRFEPLPEQDLFDVEYWS